MRIGFWGEQMADDLALLDVVALLEDLSEAGLTKGQVGTVIELLDERTALVEFSGEDGRAYAIAPIAKARLLVLRYEPAAA